MKVLSGEVQSNHIDSNGHANISFYAKIFDEATFKFQSIIGLPHETEIDHRLSLFASRMLVSYKSEMFVGEKWEIDACLYQLGKDRLGIFHRLKTASRITCTCYMLCISVSLPDRKITNLTSEVFENSKKHLMLGMADPF